MERQCWANAQFIKWDCLDITGISSKVEADVIEEKVENIFKKLYWNIPSNRIKACHRVSKMSAKVIVKFSSKKDCQ